MLEVLRILVPINHTCSWELWGRKGHGHYLASCPRSIGLFCRITCGPKSWVARRTTEPDFAMLGRLRGLVEKEVFKEVVDSIWGMEDAIEGYKRVNSQRARGKVIIEVQKE